MLVPNRPSDHEGVWGFGDIAPRVLDFGTKWRCVVRLKPHLIPPQEEHLTTQWLEV